ncbi:hypothetical protein MJN85_30500, partial [Salmonella enterica subsp. enterica serovar Anatum]|nr:hypothetical protein [Salmonella enterica subsp. enterica serovar Anatum]
LPGVPYQILPLKSADKTYGLAIVEPGNLRQLMVPEQQRLLETGYEPEVQKVFDKLLRQAGVLEEQYKATNIRKKNAETLRNKLN